MLVLGINTVGNACDAALVAGGEVLAARTEEMEQGHDARLAPLVAELLAEAGRTPQDLARIAVVIGPGSFAGVRVGVAFARGLALALGAPVAGITSLEAMPEGQAKGRQLAILPARLRPPQQSWWAQVLVDGRGASAPVEADTEALSKMAHGAERICGWGYLDLHIGLPHVRSAPSAAVAANLVAARVVGDLAPAFPIYAREPDATPMARP